MDVADWLRRLGPDQYAQFWRFRRIVSRFETDER